MTVRVDARTAYEPDALVDCGERLWRDDIVVPAPVIVVDIDRPLVVHHARDGDEIRTRLVPSGPLRLDPPGLDLAVEDLFGEA